MKNKNNHRPKEQDRVSAHKISFNKTVPLGSIRGKSNYEEELKKNLKKKLEDKK